MTTENSSAPSSPGRVGIVMDSPRHGSSSDPNNNLLGPAALHGADYAELPSRSSNISKASSFSDKRTKSWELGDPSSPIQASRDNFMESFVSPRGSKACNRKALSEASITLAKARARTAQRINDSMVYLDGPQIYTCGECRTHLTSHDDIISKSFHGRHGRAYLFDQCVNVVIGPAEDRLLITGLHSVCDIFCKRCKGMVGWTYAKAYEASQKYKEGKFIIEKINLHMEESDYYTVSHPAGERSDRWRLRSMSWGSETQGKDIVYEYHPSVTPNTS
mmetsp:Transcript_10582/g.15582  ORF Transcript_10582/g.15582 Transcript_10582/m.15582 type:complete len:276 (+) Transcript_10582:117-944(+)|eukprot:CAMPEP_0194219606 /NCGR_PEP_ID=MMETSP0156-20130528/26381_1 /TAXON_ID=33649 /ORGANISM="Thalassionema nitzschioides, Strain L26-B" /LENGTH=275 /DNA_ID=CAMNT_0038949345 /DNA_START=93 /DNA_END=920 /DNA_ORIENTATION=-